MDVQDRDHTVNYTKMPQVNINVDVDNKDILSDSLTGDVSSAHQEHKVRYKGGIIPPLSLLSYIDCVSRRYRDYVVRSI